MKRLWHYKNMRMGILFCFVLFVFFLGLGISLFFNSISLYPQYSINYDDLFYEELTFNRYETKRYVSGKSIGYKYEIYFEEYEKPFIINTITNKKLNKTALTNLEENDIIKVYYRQDFSKKYEHEICEISNDSTILLSLSDYVRLNQNNQITGMIFGPIFILCNLFLIVKFIFILKNLTRKIDLGDLKIEYEIDGHIICVYNSTTACSLVINGQIVDQYRGAMLYGTAVGDGCNLKGKLKTKEKEISIEAKMQRGNLQLYSNGNLLTKKFVGFN